MKYPPLQPGQCYHIYNRANGKENLFRKTSDYRHFLQRYDKYVWPVADTYAWVLMPNHFHLLVRIREGVVYRYSKEDFVSSLPPNADRSGRRARATADAVGLGGMKKLRFEDVKWETIPDPSASPINDNHKNASLVATNNADNSDQPSNRPDGINGETKRKTPNPTNHFSHLCNAYAKYINDKYRRHGALFQRPFRRKHVDNENYLRRLVLYIHNNPVHHGFVDSPEEYPWSSYHTCLMEEPTKLKREEVINWFGDIKNFKAVHRSYTDYKEMEAWLEEEEQQ